MAIAEKFKTPEKALKNMEKDLYPNIHVLLFLAATIPVTSYKCARSISMLKLIKTPLRSTDNDPGEAKWVSHDAI